MMTSNTTGERIRRRREELGLTQTDLADKAGISRTYLSLIERGEAANFSYNVLSYLALALETTPATLTGESDDEVLVSSSLREFALEERLDLEEVIGLSKLALRGREPKTADEWRKLYSAIASALGDED